MISLRLNCAVTEKHFVINPRYLIGYVLDPIEKSIGLLTEHYSFKIDNSVTNWDNWDEFIEQLKAQFEDTNDDF